MQDESISQKNLTSEKEESTICPAQSLLKMLSGKFKPEVFRLAMESPLRFGSLQRQIEGSNKQTLSIALRELEELSLLEKVIVREKPLHIEYYLTEKGKALVPVFRQLEGLV